MIYLVLKEPSGPKLWADSLILKGRACREMQSLSEVWYYLYFDRTHEEPVAPHTLPRLAFPDLQLHNVLYQTRLPSSLRADTGLLPHPSQVFCCRPSGLACIAFIAFISVRSPVVPVACLAECNHCDPAYKPVLFLLHATTVVCLRSFHHLVLVLFLSWGYGVSTTSGLKVLGLLKILLPQSLLYWKLWCVATRLWLIIYVNLMSFGYCPDL